MSLECDSNFLADMSMGSNIRLGTHGLKSLQQSQKASAFYNCFVI